MMLPFFFLFLTSLPPQTELSLRHARLCIVDKLLWKGEKPQLADNNSRTATSSPKQVSGWFYLP